MINFRIIALDPGGTTGWATYSAKRTVVNSRCEFSEEKWAYGQLGPSPHYDALDALLGNQHVVYYTLVVESFSQYRDLNPVDLIPLEYIGVIKRFAQERKLIINFQSSSQGKIGRNGFVRASNLQALDLWYPSKPHAMDAVGHLLYFMVNSKDRGVTLAKRNDILKKGWK